jgi:hypothetical protein
MPVYAATGDATTGRLAEVHGNGFAMVLRKASLAEFVNRGEPGPFEQSPHQSTRPSISVPTSEERGPPVDAPMKTLLKRIKLD